MPHQARATDSGLNYLLYLPKDYNPQQMYPTILFLHGSGERGNDLALVKLYGLPKRVADGEDFPFIIVSPQCPSDIRWITLIEQLGKLLDEVETTFAVDASRFYLTGMSMGGQGAWALAVEHPTRFAAIAPICARQIDEPQQVCLLKDTPIWVFHGAKDETVTLDNSELMVEMLKACGGNVRFTIYPEADHDSWSETYDNPQLYTWFLEHQRV